ncbi:hypothetical protein D3C76_1230720 [compost metagenome]
MAGNLCHRGSAGNGDDALADCHLADCRRAGPSQLDLRIRRSIRIARDYYRLLHTEARLQPVLQLGEPEQLPHHRFNGFQQAAAGIADPHAVAFHIKKALGFKKIHFTA